MSRLENTRNFDLLILFEDLQTRFVSRYSFKFEDSTLHFLAFQLEDHSFNVHMRISPRIPTNQMQTPPSDEYCISQCDENPHQPIGGFGSLSCGTQSLN